MVETGQRTSVDHEGETAARLQAERDGQCRADRSAVHDRDDVLAAMSLGHTRDRRPNPFNEIDKALAVRRPFVRRRVPE